jgi:uncharacterized protein YoxC
VTWVRVSLLVINLAIVAFLIYVLKNSRDAEARNKNRSGPEAIRRIAG